MRRHHHYMALIVQKALAELISESRRGYMGMLWWVIEPVLYMGVFYLIFDVLSHRGGKSAVAFLLVGLVVWKWIATSIPQCAGCIQANAGLIQQVYIPKWVFPGMVVTTTTIKFLIVFTLLLAFLLIAGFKPAPAWFSIPIIMIVQILMLLAVGNVLAAIVPFFPDLKLIVDNTMMLLFFLSGVFIHFNAASPKYLYMNPITQLIESYRHVLMNGAWPDWETLGIIALASLIGIAAGGLLLNRNDQVYAKVLW